MKAWRTVRYASAVLVMMKAWRTWWCGGGGGGIGTHLPLTSFVPLGHGGIGGFPQWFGSLDGGSHGGLQFEIPGGHGGGSIVGVASVGVGGVDGGGCVDGGGRVVVCSRASPPVGDGVGVG
jgi:hypothetical protein